MFRVENELGWYDCAVAYVDMKWPTAAATSRRSTAEALVSATMAMIVNGKGKPSDTAIRSALYQWGFNTKRRAEGTPPDRVATVLAWLADNTHPVRVLSDPERLRPVVNAIATKLDGTPAAATVVGRKRAVLYNLLDYAIERKQLKVNPLPLLKWTVPKAAHEVDEETVVNAAQARTLLREMSEVRRSGRRLVACFAASYYSGLRPEEAINLRRSNVSIPALVVNTGKAEPPENDWGEFKLRKAAPHAGRSWTDSGLDRDERGLKHRARTAVRRVPIPPDLTRLLRAHLEEFPPDSEGRLFHAERGGPIPAISYQRVWHRARTATFTEDVLASPLAETPYTLRHAAVSTWLAAGIPPTQVAEWAGHSVDVLLKVYAKTLHGHDRLARERWQQALG